LILLMHKILPHIWSLHPLLIHPMLLLHLPPLAIVVLTPTSLKSNQLPPHYQLRLLYFPITIPCLLVKKMASENVVFFVLVIIPYPKALLHYLLHTPWTFNVHNCQPRFSLGFCNERLISCTSW
jgi:hypothetical protein